MNEEADRHSRGSKKRVFIVEDEWLLATLLEEMLLELGHTVFAVASKLKDGLRMAEQGDFDFAILDVSLQGERSLAIADILDARGLPYAFATGYGLAGVEVARHAPVLPKPYGIEDLRRIMPKT